ncbi:hypothetical protein PRIC2_001855 [Phytophthora ramorum]
MAAADSARQRPPGDKNQQQEETYQVHEITESSSDESGDEAPARTTAEEEEDEDEEKMPGPEVLEKMRAGVYMPEPEELYKTKNVADMHYLFTNDKLKDESPALVLRSDPFCIPRVTDNVPNYRPMLNPLSIFLGEDKLLPRSFRLDPSEQVPKAEEKAAAKQDGRLPPLPGSSASSTSSGNQHRGKTSAFMGTMPRQTEFAEIPVSEKLFQNHEVFRPSAPVPHVPASPSRDQRLTNSTTSSCTSLSTTSSETDQTAASPGASAAVSYSDAMLLSSIQHTLDVTTAALAGTDSSISSLDSAADSTSTYQIQQLQPLESVADTLTNYLPTRSSALPDDSRLADGQYFGPGGYNPAASSMGYAANSAAHGTFGSLLSPANSQPGTPYTGLFVDSGAVQNATQSIQTFSSALGSISITTPTNNAAGIHSGLITPQGGIASSSAGTPRRSGAKKPRAKNVFRPCASPGCTKGARGKSGLCQKHGGGKRCATPGCPKGAQGSSTMCLFHGGGYRCTVEGCSTGARGTSGLCAKHGGYKKGKAGATSKRGPAVDGTAVKRVRIDDLQPPPVAVVKAE